MKEAELHKNPCAAPGCENRGRRLDPNLKDEFGRTLRTEKGGKIYCEPHHRRLMQYGDPLAGPPVRRGRVNITEGAICSEPDCGKSVHAKGKCLTHWMQDYRAQNKEDAKKNEAKKVKASSRPIPVGEGLRSH